VTYFLDTKVKKVKKVNQSFVKIWISRKWLKIETQFQMHWDLFLRTYKTYMAYPICDLLSGHYGRKSESTFCQNVDISKTIKDRNSIPSALELVYEGLQKACCITHM
jgi:hypothetical protein